MESFLGEYYNYIRGLAVTLEEKEAGAEAGEARSGQDRIEDRESHLSRFGFPDGDNYWKEKGYRNDGDGNRDRDGNSKALSILTDDLSLRLYNVHDPLGGMPIHRVELVRSMSSRKIHILYGSISAHLVSQGAWGVRSGAAALFISWVRIIMNSIGSRIISLGGDKA